MQNSKSDIQNQIKHGKTLSMDLFLDRQTGDIAKWLGYIFWPAIIALTILFFWITVKNSYHLSSNDTFYYLSIAENMLNNGLFMDGTFEPNGPIITPQNAIVIIFYFLMKMSLTHSQCIMTVVIMNYFVMFLSFYPLIKIAERLGLTDRLSKYALITVYVGSVNVFRWLLVGPLNDMFFLCGSFFLTYLMVRLYDQIYSDRKVGKSLHKVYLVFAIILSIVLVHFRINALFIPLAAIGAAVLTRRFRILPISITLFALMYVSTYGLYAFIDTTNYEKVYGLVDKSFTEFFGLLYILIFKLVPASLFKDLSDSGNLVYLPFYLAMAITLVKGIVQRKFLLLMILFMSIMLFVLTLLVSCVTYRYLWIVMPFMYMMILSVKKFRPIAMLFIAAVLINSFWMIYNGIGTPARTALWLHVSEKFEFEKDELVIAFDRRMCWYHTGLKKPYKEEYTWQQIQSAEKLYLAGKGIFFDEHSQKIKDMARQNEHEVRIEHLTPEYNDWEKNGLYRVHLEPKAQN